MLRCGRVLATLLPREPEVRGLLSLMEFQASDSACVNHDSRPVLPAEQDRSRWDRTHIGRCRMSLASADALGRGRGSYCLQAAIAQCHAPPAVSQKQAGTR
jgi:predicted RNA polymerase sigma factor